MGTIKNPFIKIAVVGGTEFDSKRGAEILRQKGIPCDAIGISLQPQEQAELYRHTEKLTRVFHEKAGSLYYHHLVLFCNSLSFAAPWDTLYPGRITELTAVYKKLLKQINPAHTAIVVAEPSTKTQIEKLAAKHKICPPEALHIFPRLDLILQLEKEDETIQRQLILQEIKDLQRQGFSEIILGCTHLDHPDFYKFKDVKIHQPGLEMMDAFVALYQSQTVR